MAFRENMFERFEVILLSNSTYLNCWDELCHIKGMELKLTKWIKLSSLEANSNSDI
jgi:hypothetical protein